MDLNADLDLSRERMLQSRVWQLEAEIKRLQSDNKRLRSACERIVGTYIYNSKCKAEYLYEIAQQATQ